MELVFQKKNIGLGKRKQAIARVFLIPGEGNIIINKTLVKNIYNITKYLGMVWSTIGKIKFRKTI
jgi:ribosomal protein S9